MNWLVVLMSKYQFFRNRVGVEVGDKSLGANKKFAMTKVKNNLAFDRSPTKSQVIINDSEELVDCIVSHDDKMWEKRFLFRPDTYYPLGTYVSVDNGDYGVQTYLAWKRTTDSLYPQLFGVICNTYYEIVTGKKTITTGYDSTGLPIREVVEEKRRVKCHATTQAYSALSNSAIPLPSGAMNIYIPYDVEYANLIKLNDKYVNKHAEYKVIEIVREHVLEESNEGYLKIYLQREVDKFSE